jgi:hypothetical protein
VHIKVPHDEFLRQIKRLIADQSARNALEHGYRYTEMFHRCPLSFKKAESYRRIHNMIGNYSVQSGWTRATDHLLNKSNKFLIHKKLTHLPYNTFSINMRLLAIIKKQNKFLPKMWISDTDNLSMGSCRGYISKDSYQRFLSES